MWLPDEEARAVEIVELFLSLGADPTIRNKDGMTAADLATKRGLDEAAALLSLTPGDPRPATALESPPRGSAEYHEALAKDLVAAYESGDAAAIQRLNDHYGRSFTHDDVRADIWHSVYKVRQTKGRPGCFTSARG